ncbi:MAG TPA: NAD(P)/FAD-dependent oxidoreductase [Polyangiaceae bacterium]|nr:NAD(P)/FAD-dependent oxidoreductase [Polyangiaceae bacterium]
MPVSSAHFRVIVIGGGPSGATVASLLARDGHRVLLLEKEHFPRFHIGESLLPCSTPLLEQLGVLEQMERVFLPKHGAEFVTADGSLERRYAFGDGSVPGPSQAFEVERSEFDKILLDNAARIGVDVRQGVQVTGVEFSDTEVRVEARSAEAGPLKFTAEFLVDASGQSSFLAGRLKLRSMDSQLRNYSVFSHFVGAERHSGLREGDISIVLVPEGWWWVIPLRNDRTSVGLVAPSASLKGQKPDTRFLESKIQSTPYLARRLARAERVADVRALSDWSYTSTRFVGQRFALVGDAAAFIDPVFSTGVYLGMSGAFRAARAIDQVLRRDRTAPRALADYERFVRRNVQIYRKFVHGFYDPAFVEVLLQPSDWMGLRAAITSLLAGFGVESADVRWRASLFRMVARANRHLRLVPRLPERRSARPGVLSPFR